MNVVKIKCNPKNYSYGSKRSYDSITTIVIHYTANKGDTAENNGNYFKNNVTKTSAHYFIDRNGVIVKSVNRNKIAWHAGDWDMNVRSIGIELCDIVDQPVSLAQKKALKAIIKSIKKQCKNVNTIIRHYDVTGKLCPKYYVEHEDEWKKLKTYLKKALV